MNKKTNREKILNTFIEFIKEIESTFLHFSERNINIIVDRIYSQKSAKQIAKKYKISLTRVYSIEQKFWYIIRYHLSNYIEIRKNKKIYEKNILLFNPKRIIEIINENDYTIDKYNISISSVIKLNNAGIFTIKQLSTKTEADLLKIERIGKKNIKNIKECINKYGYSLKKE